MWNPFSRPTRVQIDDIPEAAILTTAAAVQTPTTSVAPSHVIFKRLKWVRARGRTGIIWELDSSGYAMIHFTNSIGETVETGRVPCGELKLAAYEDIPVARRGERAVAAALGYI